MRVPGPFLALSLVPLVSAGVLTATPVPVTSGPGSPDAVDFTRDVRPILSENCFQCHGPDTATREAGLRLDTREGALGPVSGGDPAIVPGDVEGSELSYRITAEFEADLMPPPSSGKALTTAQVEILQRWIEEGASWGKHWAFEPPNAGLIADADAGIDGYIAARLAERGLSMRDEADAGTLLRRVSLDLVGLPPNADERATFHADVAARGLDTAYAAAVDRLLASPRYGVHMARPWLDAARYADTHGLHLDNLRSMWPYRDWVVDALNDNKPFDEFTVEQLAGDLLPDATLEQRIASGFNRCNPTSAEGGMIAEEYLSIYAKDRADTTATIWLGLTMGCAQCHDHKYDPISQREYYGMYAFFNSIAEEASDRNIDNPVPFVRTPQPDDRARLEAIEARGAELTAVLERPDPALDAAERAWSDAASGAARSEWRLLLPETASATGGAQLSVDDATGVVRASGENPAKTVYTIDAWVPPGSIEGVRLDALATGGKRIPGRATNENFVLTHVEILAAPADQPGRWSKVDLRAAVASFSQDSWPIDGVLDPSPATGWAGLGLAGDRSALFVPARAFGHAAGTDLRVVLRFESVHGAHSFESLRLAVKRTSAGGGVIGEGVWHHARFPAESAQGLFQREAVDPASIANGIDLGEAAAPGVPWVPEPGFANDAVVVLGRKTELHYLVRRIWSSERRAMDLRLGSDDGIVVWLRGEEILSKNVARGAALDQEIVPIVLEPGVNELVLKIVNTGGTGAFAYRLWDRTAELGIPPAIELALLSDADARTTAQADAVRLHFRRRHAPEWAAAYEGRLALAAERAEVESQVPTTLVSEELMERRPAHLLMRGAYDKKGDRVEPVTPSVLPPMREDLPRDRLGLARWIVSEDHPLTARVWVNRAWQHFFGRGIVATPEDFGAQGAWPSHPELLDWLALTFVNSGWDMKGMHRRIVLSRAYRQDSSIPAELLEADPENILVSRGPRFRLDGEVIRDQALLLGGLLDETLGGPGVRPYQPDGVWFAVGYSGSNTVRYRQGPLEHLHRRSLYTFWKRTAPPPNMTTFDAPMRDACTVVRERTNTPLQALVTLNGPTFVEAAKFAAARTLSEPLHSADDRAAFLFDHIVGRPATDDERARLANLAAVLTSEYRLGPEDAAMLLAVGDLESDTTFDPAEHAAWTLVASALLNLDEVLTKS